MKSDRPVAGSTVGEEPEGLVARQHPLQGLDAGRAEAAAGHALVQSEATLVLGEEPHRAG